MYQHTIDSGSVEAAPIGVPGVTIKAFWRDPGTGAVTVITTMEAGATIPKHMHTRADETVFVLRGDFIEDGVAHGPVTYFVGSKGAALGPHRTQTGCTVLTHFSAELDFAAVE